MEVDGSLYNEDLAPIPLAKRTWGLYNYASLWVAMSVCIPTYMLASGLIAGGMAWWQAIGTILLGNLIVLVPMLLNAHAGTKYGIPFPVFVRASFGVRGANVPAVLRALVACGWFGIQTWIGGQAIFAMLSILWPMKASQTGVFVCFSAFWLLNIIVILRGIDTIKFLEGIAAPFMLGVGLLLLWWVTSQAGGLGPVLSTPSKFKTTAGFLKFFIPSLTGMVGFWATVALNIPDFTRYARNQREQIIGQALALPTTMTLYSFVGIAVTSATVVIYGTAIWDPVQLLSRFHSPVAVVISLVAILLATLNVNIGANVVSPANDFSNLWPKKISFRSGGVITCFMGVALMPWKLLSSYSTFIMGWLGGYAAFLGPVAGIMICDYFVIRRRTLNVEDLYLRNGAYEYSHGFNWRAVIALGLGAGTALSGLSIPAMRFLYDYSWFVGFVISFVAYYAQMRRLAASTLIGKSLM